MENLVAYNCIFTEYAVCTVYIHGFYINVDTSLTVDHELFTYHETLWSHCITYKISWFDPYTVQLTSLIWEVCDILQINA